MCWFTRTPIRASRLGKARRTPRAEKGSAKKASLTTNRQEKRFVVENNNPNQQFVAARPSYATNGCPRPRLPNYLLTAKSDMIVITNRRREYRRGGRFCSGCSGTITDRNGGHASGRSDARRLRHHGRSGRARRTAGFAMGRHCRVRRSDSGHWLADHLKRNRRGLAFSQINSFVARRDDPGAPSFAMNRAVVLTRQAAFQAVVLR